MIIGSQMILRAKNNQRISKIRRDFLYLLKFKYIKQAWSKKKEQKNKRGGKEG